ncbi:MAG: hypothetical protein ABEJ34_02095 [Haloferacaceae archaeon]
MALESVAGALTALLVLVGLAFREHIVSRLVSLGDDRGDVEPVDLRHP